MRNTRPFHKAVDIVLKILDPCVPIIDIGPPVKTQVGNDIDRILNFQGQNIYVSDQSIFINIYGPSYQRRKKTNTSNTLTAAQSRTGYFMSFMIKVHPDQADQKYNYSHMT